MSVTLCSAFRDSASYLDRYLAQMVALGNALAARGDTLTCIWGEGDSADDTRARLLREVVSGRQTAQVVDVSHGGKYHGNIVHPERFAQLAHVWGRIWARIPDEAGAVLFLESDLVWEADTLVRLLDRLETCDVVAPIIYLERPGYPRGTFYDVWAGRKNGKHFRSAPPYHPGYTGAGLLPMDSVGSCVAFRGDVARKLVWDAGLIAGLCDQARAQGDGVYLDQELGVTHL